MHPIERLRYVARAGDTDPALLAEDAALALGALSHEPRALVPAARRLLEFHPGCAPLWWVCAELLSADRPGDRSEELAVALAEDPTADELAAALPGAATLATTGGVVIASALRERPDLTVQLVGTPGGLRYQLRRIGDTVEVEGFLAHEIPEALADATLVVVEAEAVGPEGALLGPLPGSLLSAADGREVWVVAGCGRLLPSALFSALRSGITRPKPPSAGRRGLGRSFEEFHDDLEEGFAGDSDEGLSFVAIEEIAVIVGPDGPERPRAAFARLRCPVPPELLVTVRR